MQGLWKDSRKNFLRDKSRYISKHVYSFERSQEECKGAMFKKELTTIEYKQERKIGSVNLVDMYVDGKFYSAFEYRFDSDRRSKYIDIYSGDNIATVFEAVFVGKTYTLPKTLNIVSREFIHHEKLDNSRVYIFPSKVMLYNKPFDWLDISRYRNDSTRRTFFSKYICHSNRMYVRKFLSRADWDEEIKVHQGTKSYWWLID